MFYYLYYHFFVIIVIVQFFLPVYAEITHDGSLGLAGALLGPNYRIEASRGTLMGNNLFHSFSQFDIDIGESATFTGADHIANIIGRVTGGKPSIIKGELISKIPNADLYLLNPSGVMMGPNASLNIDGSFHLSSADYLRFADGQRFDTHSSTPPLLSIATPQAFGFLDNKPGNLIIRDNQLNVPNGKDFSIVGGDVQIEKSVLSTFGGNIQIASATSAGEVTRADVMNNTLSQQGNIVIKDNTIINVGNEATQQRGAITIQGGQLQIDGSHLQTQTIRGQAGNLILTAQQMLVKNSSISSTTQDGQTGTIQVQANEHLEISGTSAVPFNGLWTTTKNRGNGGDITVSTPILLMIGNAGIATQTEGTGNAGNIVLNVNRLIFKEGGRVNASSTGAGNGGDITVIVDDSAEMVGRSTLLPNGKRQPSAIGSSAFASGNGGTIRMTVKNALKLDERATIQTLTRGDGKAGDIFINVKDLTIAQGADIDASNEGSGQGKGGNITINATGNVLITAETTEKDELQPIVKDGFLGGVYSVAKNAGTGGDVNLSAKQLILREGGTISVGSIGLGNAGNLTLSVDGTLTMNNAAIITQATEAGGGNISIETPINIHLTNNSTITAQAQGIQSTDKGGNIAIKNQAIFTLDNSQLLANAYAGNGGYIDIKTNQFNILGNSTIDVSSQLGLNGEFILNSTKLTDDFLVLPLRKFSQTELSLSRCAGLSREDLSDFFVIIRDVLPSAPGDLKTHFYLSEDEPDL